MFEPQLIAIEDAIRKELWENIPQLDDDFRHAVEYAMRHTPETKKVHLRDSIGISMKRYQKLLSDCHKHQTQLQQKSHRILKQQQAAQKYIS